MIYIYNFILRFILFYIFIYFTNNHNNAEWTQIEQHQPEERGLTTTPAEALDHFKSMW